MAMTPIAVTDYDCITALGAGMAALREGIAAGKSGLVPNDLEHSDLPTWIGRVPRLSEHLFSGELASHASRDNALIETALALPSLRRAVAELRERYPSQRIGIVMGSSTSSIDRTELAYRRLDASGHLAPEFLQPQVLNPHAPGAYVALRTGIEGPVMTLNTACSSSAKVFASGARWLETGLVDAVLVGGADALGLSVLHGFHSLQLVSSAICKPFDRLRDGINIGEAAGFAVLERTAAAGSRARAWLSGYGESSDAHHMSHPHPEGAGARLAILAALERAGLAPDAIDYVNLHGTASRANDWVEGRLMAALFPATTVCSSTKAWTGHTLGAAGIVESLIAVDVLTTQLAPGTLNHAEPDPEIPLRLTPHNQPLTARRVMSNSFGFGGNNCSLVFSAA